MMFMREINLYSYSCVIKVMKIATGGLKMELAESLRVCLTA